MTVRHGAVCAGLALALIFGAAAPVFADDLATQVPQQEGADTTAPAGGGSSTGDGADPATDVADVAAAAPDAAAAIAAVPTNVDRAATSQDSVAGALARSAAPAAASRTQLRPVSDEMKYFTINESGQNYDQGFGAGDGYNALGYYQFDRRWSLVSFLNFCVSYDAQTFSMFQPVLAVASELSSSAVSMYDVATGQLTDVGRLADSAWHAAYAANPTLFAALQDEFAISNYYRPTESWLKSALGIDITGRADCVKGLVWSLTNLFGTGGVQKYLIAANLSNDMTDREFVNAIVDSFPASLSTYLPDTPYYTSYVNRYERERQTCLSYIAADEAAAQQPAVDEPVADEPATDDPVTDDPATDQPSADQPTQGQPTPGQPTPGTPGANDSASSQPDSNGAVADQPGTGDSGSNQGDSNQDASDQAGSGQSAMGGASNVVTSQLSTSAPNKAPARPKQTQQGDGASDGESASDADGAADGPTDVTDSSTGAGTESDADGNGAGASDGSATEGESAKSSSEDGGAKSDGAKADTGKTGSDPDTGKSDFDTSKTGSDTGTKTTGAKQTSTGDGNTDGNGNTGVIPAANMPKTGDLVMLSILASGSLAAFGATAVYTGRTSAKGIEQVDEADDGTSVTDA